jgi:hypothetical protein
LATGLGSGGATLGPVDGSVLETEGSGCVEGSAGGRERCGIGSRSDGISTFPLETKTFACGFATITRGGGATMRPDFVCNSAAGSAAGVAGATGGGVWIAGGIGGGGRTAPSGGTGCDGFWGKSGVVFALEGAPVTGGAEGRGAEGVWAGVFEMLGIGLVTAVDQAGGTFETGAGSSWPEVVIGSVVAAETLGRCGVILAEAGLSGRGGRLIRSVSRLGALGSEPSGLAESAIIFPFYSYSGKCSMAKFAIVTYL